jgi:hypothetical protein
MQKEVTYSSTSIKFIPLELKLIIFQFLFGTGMARGNAFQALHKVNHRLSLCFGTLMHRDPMQIGGDFS